MLLLRRLPSPLRLVTAPLVFLHGDRNPLIHHKYRAPGASGAARGNAAQGSAEKFRRSCGQCIDRLIGRDPASVGSTFMRLYIQYTYPRLKRTSCIKSNLITWSRNSRGCLIAILPETHSMDSHERIPFMVSLRVPDRGMER